MSTAPDATTIPVTACRTWMWPDTASSDTPDSIHVCSSSRHTCTMWEYSAWICQMPSFFRARPHT